MDMRRPLELPTPSFPNNLQERLANITHPVVKTTPDKASKMVLKIYGMTVSTCTRRVATVCKVLDIPYELIGINFATVSLPGYPVTPALTPTDIDVRSARLSTSPLRSSRSSPSDRCPTSTTTASPSSSLAPSAVTSRSSTARAS